jgi:hypothetical protein
VPDRRQTHGSKWAVLWFLLVLIVLAGGIVAAYYFLSLGAHRVVMKWAPTPGATSYNVYRSPVSGGPYVQVGVSPTADYVDRRVPTGISYYVVTSVVNQRESKPSNEASAFIPDS